MGSDAAKADPKKVEKKEEKKSLTTVFRAEIHCRGCLTKLRKAVMKIEGVESIDVDQKKQMVTVVGNADAKKVMVVVQKTGKNVQLIEPKQKKEEKNEDKKKEEKKEDKKEEKKEEKKDQKKEVKQEAILHRIPNNELTYFFSEENPNNCSIM